MKLNKNTQTHILPYTIVLIDATDTYYYSDVMDNMEPVETLEDLSKAKDIADAIFVLKNNKWESLEAMNKLDAGFDVRIYDKQLTCVYAAHETFKDNWIGSRQK